MRCHTPRIELILCTTLLGKQSSDECNMILILSYSPHLTIRQCVFEQTMTISCQHPGCTKRALWGAWDVANNRPFLPIACLQHRVMPMYHTDRYCQVGLSRCTISGTHTTLLVPGGARCCVTCRDRLIRDRAFLNEIQRTHKG